MQSEYRTASMAQSSLMRDCANVLLSPRLVRRRSVPERVVVLNDYARGGGGAGALARQSAIALKAKGIDVVYISGDAGRDETLESHSVRCVGLNEAPLLQTRNLVRGLYNAGASELLENWIVENDTPETIYHLHNWSHIFSPSIFAPLRMVAGRVVISAHDFFIACPNGAFVHFPTNRPCVEKPLSAGCLLSQCDKRSYSHKIWRAIRQGVREALYDVNTLRPRILAIHQGMRPYLERSGIAADLIDVALNPVKPFRETRITAENNREFVYVGRLDYEKGPDIAAAAAAKASVPLRIIGDGPMRQELAARYPDVIFDGQLSKAEIDERVGAACALVMPTRYPEPFGLVAVEALWSGLPVIVSDTSFFASEVESTASGLCFKAGDEQSLVGAMTRLREQAALRRFLSKNAFYRTRHLANSPQAWIDALIGNYERLLGWRGGLAGEECYQQSPGAGGVIR